MKYLKRPSLNDLRAFEAAARLGSLRAAGDDLALTHGAVSRRISKLSHDLGFPLFEKSGRGLRLTAEGRTLFSAVNRLFGELEETVERLRAPLQEKESTVILSCERSVAMRWLIPRLSRFQDAHPEITLHLSVGGGPLDFKREGVELALRRLDFPIPSQWQVVRLFPERVGPILSSQLLAGFEEGNYRGIGSKTRPNGWSDYLARHPDIPRPKDIQFHDHHFLMVEAALAGLGVALSPQVLALDDIDRGRLQAPKGFTEDGTHYALIFLKDTPRSEGAKKLIA